MKPLIVSDAAADDVERAAAWYDRQRRGLGREFDVAVSACLAAIERYPSSFAHARGKAIRQRALVERFPYIVYFTETPTHVSITAIIHARQRIGPILRRRNNG